MKAIKARKVYRCKICEKPIKKGESYEPYEYFAQTYRGLRRLMGKQHLVCPKGKKAGRRGTVR